MYEFVGRGMESYVVEVVKGSFEDVVCYVVGVVVCMVVDVFGELGFVFVVGVVSIVEGFGVVVDGVVVINIGIFGGEVGFVEVIGVLYVVVMYVGFENDGCIRIN